MNISFAFFVAISLRLLTAHYSQEFFKECKDRRDKNHTGTIHTTHLIL